MILEQPYKNSAAIIIYVSGLFSQMLGWLLIRTAQTSDIQLLGIVVMTTATFNHLAAVNVIAASSRPSHLLNLGLQMIALVGIILQFCLASSAALPLLGQGADFWIMVYVNFWSTVGAYWITFGIPDAITRARDPAEICTA